MKRIKNTHGNTFIRIFIDKPVMTTSLAILILLLGIASLFHIPVRLLPIMNQGVIQVQTYYAGAAPKDVQSFVTTKIQSAITGIPGIDYMKSQSSQGLSLITLILNSDADIDTLQNTVTQKVDSILSELPQGITAPNITKNMAGNTPMLIFAVKSKSRNPLEVADYLSRSVEPQIEAVDGVKNAMILSGGDYAMQIWLNPLSMRTFNMTANDVVTALNQQSVLAAPGITEGKSVNYQVSTNTKLNTVAEFNNLIIKNTNHHAIKLKDVGYAELGAENDFNSVWIDGTPGTLIFVSNVPEANPLSVAHRVMQVWQNIIEHLPGDLEASVILNITDYINRALVEVLWTLFLTTLIVAATLWLFLKESRVIAVPMVTIPLSLLGMVFLLNVLGFSINIITLLAMVLAIGLVVDDAIVVVENILKTVHSGLKPRTATLKATKELITPVIAMTITLAAVFAPIGFSGGLVGQLFKEFAFTLAMSVIISGVIALTITPMMCARIITEKTDNHNWRDSAIDRLSNKYQVALTTVFQYKKLVLLLWLLITLLVGVLYHVTPKNLMPTEDMGYLMVFGQPPGSANRAYIEKYLHQIKSIFEHIPVIQHTVSWLNNQTLISFVTLDQVIKPKVNLVSLVPQLQTQLADVSGLSLGVQVPPLIQTDTDEIAFVLQSPDDFQTLYRYAKLLEEQAQGAPEFRYLMDNLNFSQPEAHIELIDAAIESANVTHAAIANTISSLMSQGEIQRFAWHGQSYNVVVKTEHAYQLNPEDLKNIAIPTQTVSSTGQAVTVPLGSLASIHYSVAPTSLNQFQKQDSVTIEGALAPGYSLSDAITAFNKLVAAHLPKTINVDYAGTVREFIQEGHRLLWIFALAILIIFLVLSMQFESYRDALIILLGSIPLALFAALIPLKFGIGEMNVFSQIGLLTLVGLISKHGILITKFANELKAEGLSIQDAVIQAAIRRFRPILMTTAAMVLGAVPLMLATGASSVSRHVVGTVIFYGMSLGSVLTLLILPVIYTTLTSHTNVQGVAHAK